MHLILGRTLHDDSLLSAQILHSGMVAVHTQPDKSGRAYAILFRKRNQGKGKKKKGQIPIALQARQSSYLSSAIARRGSKTVSSISGFGGAIVHREPMWKRPNGLSYAHASACFCFSLFVDEAEVQVAEGWEARPTPQCIEGCQDLHTIETSRPCNVMK